MIETELLLFLSQSYDKPIAPSTVSKNTFTPRIIGEVNIVYTRYIWEVLFEFEHSSTSCIFHDIIFVGTENKQGKI